MLPYWPRARRWASEATQVWSPKRAAPSILALVTQWWLDLQPMTRALVMGLTVILSYAATYAVHYTWNLLIRAPVALDRRRQEEIDEAAQREQRLVADIQEVRSASAIDPLETARKHHVEELISGLSIGAKRILRHLLNFGELRSAQLRACGIEQQALSEGLSFGRRSGLIQERRDHPASSGSTLWINRDLHAPLDAVLRDQNI